MGKLLDFYKTVMGQEYSDKEFEDRVAMQKIVFIAEKKGLGIGNYRFFWKERGPYSPYLRLDVVSEVKELESGIETPGASFSEFENEVLSKIKELLAGHSGEERVYWLELIASLNYIAYNEMRISGEQLVCAELLSRKNHFAEDKWDLKQAWGKSESLTYC